MANDRTLPTRYGIKVFVNESGSITIEQENPLQFSNNEEPIRVVVDREDAELIAQWLTECAEECGEDG